jgi:hypothetical protein
MLTPWLLVLLNGVFRNWEMGGFPIMPPLAAIAIAYALGEGSGRLACISFGCCYGKPLADLSPRWRRWLAPVSVVYYGHTKKIAYADGLVAQKVVAVQAITAVLYTAAGTAGMLLFLQGSIHPAYLLCVGVTQVWRFLSEFLRADYRGSGRISAYQMMALFAAVYAVGISVWVPSAHMAVDIFQGLLLLWNPSIIILCQIQWIGIFFYMGRSQVTGSRISFLVHKDRI